jgi:heptosyltransferase-2
MAQAATLVVGPSWVGDMVMAQALFKGLKERRPDEAIDVLAPAWSLPIVARMPEVRKGIASETRHGEFALKTRREMGHELRGEYRRAIVLPRSLKSALVPWFAGIPKRTGFLGESRFLLINDVRPFDSRFLNQTVKRYVALGLEPDDAFPEIPNPTLEVSAANQEAAISRLGLSLDKPVIALMPGAEYGPAKCWPLDHFATLAGRLVDDGYRIWILGSEKEVDAGSHIADRIREEGAILNLCGKTSLEDAIDLLALTEQAVGNDSGLMFIASAVGTHVHAIYGSTSPDFAPPLTKRRDIYYLHLDCSPCRKRECPLGHLNCLRQIKADRVYRQVSQRRP